MDPLDFDESPGLICLQSIPRDTRAEQGRDASPYHRAEKASRRRGGGTPNDAIVLFGAPNSPAPLYDPLRSSPGRKPSVNNNDKTDKTDGIGTMDKM